jgi:lipopolysaccharide transport system permease protein
MDALNRREDEIRPLRDVLRICRKHTDLIWEMARREIADRYAGQALGMFWAFCHPIFLIGLYVFVFAFVFRQKVGGTVDLPLDYTAYLLSGIVAWLGIQDGLVKSCSIITSNAALVKQTVFPMEVLVIKSMAVSLFPQLVSFTMLVAYVLFTHGSLHLTYALLPVLVVVQLLGMVGLAFILAPVGAYIRDIKDVVQIFSAAGVYLLPVFYLPAWVPELFRPLLYLNPFSYIIWCYQDALYFGRFEHPWAWLVTISINTIVFWLGFRVFRKLKPGLGNLL